MRKLFVFFALLLSAAAVHAQSAADSVRAVLNTQVEAWNSGDVTGFMQGYEKSSDTTFVTSKVTKGWQAVLDRYKQNYPTREKMGTLHFGEIEIRQLDDKVAVVTGHYYLKRDAAGGSDADGLFSLVFLLKPEGWRIVLDHTN